MSLTVSQIISYIDEKHPNEWSGPEIATNLAFICGFIVLGIGLLHLGWIVEFIPLPAVAGFMTGSAINIVASQVPGLMGITGFKSVSNYLLFFQAYLISRIRTAHALLPSMSSSTHSRDSAGRKRMLPLVSLVFLLCMQFG